MQKERQKQKVCFAIRMKGLATMVTADGQWGKFGAAPFWEKYHGDYEC